MKEVLVKNQKIDNSKKSEKRQTNFSRNHSKEVDAGLNKTTTIQMKGLLDDIEETEYPFFTEKSFLDMAMGRIPDFESLYLSLSKIQVASGVPVSALQFMPALGEYTLNDPEEIENFVSNPETNHVLVQNDLIKIVLIRWEPGTECGIHGHAEGGCVFKVLKGKVVEKRFTADDAKEQLAEGTYGEGNMAYIDDQMGLHCVGNPFSEPAITLHMYTPGNYKSVKK